MNTALDYLRTASRKAVHEEDEFLENKIADAVTKSNDVKKQYWEGRTC